MHHDLAKFEQLQMNMRLRLDYGKARAGISAWRILAQGKRHVEIGGFTPYKATFSYDYVLHATKQMSAGHSQSGQRKWQLVMLVSSVCHAKLRLLVALELVESCK